eukprot:4437093-Pleurochrysis_carterae.AAC.1
MRKVFRDILDYTTASFPAAQRDQWKALKSFHSNYRTSDVMPALPLNVRDAEGGDAAATWKMQHGAP